MAQQAAELEDTDIPSPAILPPPLPSQQPTPVHPALQRQPSQNVPAAAALQTSASMPAAGAASTPAAPQGTAAEHDTSPPPAAPALLQAASVPLTKPLHAASTPSAAQAGRSQAADVAEAANALPGQLRRVPHSLVQRPSQELHPAAAGFAVTAAGAASSAVAAATGAADAATATVNGSAAPSAAMSGGQSQKSAARVWLPPAALASPQRSSGRTTTACKPETLYGSKVCLAQQYHHFCTRATRLLTCASPSVLPFPPLAPPPFRIHPSAALQGSVLAVHIVAAVLCCTIALGLAYFHLVGRRTEGIPSHC